MAIFTLRDLITSPKPTLTIGDLTISGFRNLGSTVSASQITIETIDGPAPGLIVSTVSPLSSETVSRNIGFEFRATAASAIIEGASVSLDGVTFETANAGGSVDVVIGQAGRDDDNIDFTAFFDNDAGVADDPDASGTITGGPVNTFRFDFDMFLTPEPGITATYGSTTFLFDLLDDEPPPTLAGRLRRPAIHRLLWRSDRRLRRQPRPPASSTISTSARAKAAPPTPSARPSTSATMATSGRHSAPTSTSPRSISSPTGSAKAATTTRRRRRRSKVCSISPPTAT